MNNIKSVAIVLLVVIIGVCGYFAVFNNNASSDHFSDAAEGKTSKVLFLRLPSMI